MKLKEKFLKYVSFETTSDEESTTCPSSKKELKLGEYLVDELKKYGVNNAHMDEFGYVYGKIPATNDAKQAIGLIAHMDTSPDAVGKNIKAKLLDYIGGDIVLNEELNMKLFEKDLKKHVGHQLIVTDGTTLLGADDKAGIAIIMEVVDYLFTNKVEHPAISIAFTPDEEIGMGTSHFNVEHFKEGFDSILTYTLDGGAIPVINYENFNAARADIEIKGVSIHPGSAKNVMVNSLLLAMEFNDLLPADARPENTEGYEGFNHLHSMSGDVSKTIMHYIIRNHDMKKFIAQKEDFENITIKLNKKYGEGTFTTSIKDSYFNMKDLVLAHKEVLGLPIEALKENGIEYVYEPIRGGTDGASLSFMGLVCPNLGNGGENFHGPYEYLDLTDAEKMVSVVLTMLKIC